MPSTTDHLRDIIELIELIRRQGDRLGREAFLDDVDALDATSYRLIAIGEAARAIPDSVRARQPQIPWHRVVGMRNFLAHQYFMRESSMIWETITHDLDALSDACKAECETAPDPSS